MNNLLDAIIAAKLAGGGGGGGGGDVTPASVALAISQMTDAQAAQALADLGYTVDAILDVNSLNPVQNKVLSLAFLAAQDALDRKADKTIVVETDSTTLTVTPQDNHVYNCVEPLSSLTISNPPATGAYSIVFTSGSTATTTTIPASVLGLEDFAAEANTMYEINVLDNRAVVGSWAVTP